MDRCAACGGLHFDWGELEAVLTRHPHGVANWLNRLKDSLLGKKKGPRAKAPGHTGKP